MNLLIGNGIMLFASLIMVFLGLIKDKKKIIFLQTIQIAIMAIGSIFLGTIPGAIISAFACVRNILAYNNKLTRNNKIILIILSVSFSLHFNNIGIWGLFPVVACILYISLIDTKEVSTYKMLEVISTTLWLVHDAHILAYTCVVFDVFTIATNAITYLKLKDVRIPQLRRFVETKKSY